MSLRDEKVTPETLKRELDAAGLTSKWWNENRNRDFDDLPTVGELLDYITKNGKK